MKQCKHIDIDNTTCDLDDFDCWYINDWDFGSKNCHDYEEDE